MHVWPGNKNYALGVDFSTAFKLLLGDRWCSVAELLFVMSCMVQATSAIVQTSQTLDSLLASFLFKKTFAIQILPSFEIVSWTAERCRPIGPEGFIDIADCTPFSDSGPLIISLGFMLMTVFYFPIGRGHIKETMFIQLTAFFSMFVLMLIFDAGLSLCLCWCCCISVTLILLFRVPSAPRCYLGASALGW